MLPAQVLQLLLRVRRRRLARHPRAPPALGGRGLPGRVAAAPRAHGARPPGAQVRPPVRLPLPQLRLPQPLRRLHRRRARARRGGRAEGREGAMLGQPRAWRSERAGGEGHGLEGGLGVGRSPQVVPSRGLSPRGAPEAPRGAAGSPEPRGEVFGAKPFGIASRTWVRPSSAMRARFCAIRASRSRSYGVRAIAADPRRAWDLPARALPAADCDLRVLQTPDSLSAVRTTCLSTEYPSRSRPGRGRGGCDGEGFRRTSCTARHRRPSPGWGGRGRRLSPLVVYEEYGHFPFRPSFPPA